MNLTDHQLAFFDTFGFLAFPGLFADDIDKITGAFEKIWANHGGGHFGREHDGKQRSALIQFIDQDEYLSALIDDPRIHDVCASLLGDDFNYSAATGTSTSAIPSGTQTATANPSTSRSRWPSTSTPLLLPPDACGSFRAATSTATCSATASRRCARCATSPTTPARRCGAWTATGCPPCRWR